GADGGGIGFARDFCPGGQGALEGLYASGFAAEAEQRLVLEPLKPSTANDPAILALMQCKGAVMTRRRRDLLADREWYQSAYVNEVRQAAGVDDVLYSVVPGPEQHSVFGVALYRQWGRKPFSGSERDLLDLFQQGARGAYAAIFMDSVRAATARQPSHE